MGKIVYYNWWNLYDFKTNQWNCLCDDELHKMSNMNHQEKIEFLHNWGFDDIDTSEIIDIHNTRWDLFDK